MQLLIGHAVLGTIFVTRDSLDNKNATGTYYSYGNGNHSMFEHVHTPARGILQALRVIP